MDKEELKETAGKVIDEMSHQLTELNSKKEQISSDAMEKYNESVEELQNKIKDLKSKYEELKNNAPESIEEYKKVFADAGNSFKQGFSKLSALFKKEI